MTGESHLEAMKQGIAGSQPAGESHLKFALTGGTPPGCGESHLLAGAVSAVLPLPPRMDILNVWFDHSDLSTLWQDTGGTMPVTTDGQLINRIDNKGTAGQSLLGTVSREPVWRAGPVGPFNLGYGEYVIGAPDFKQVTNATFASGLNSSTNGYTAAWIANIRGMPSIANRSPWVIAASSGYTGLEVSEVGGSNAYQTRHAQSPTSGGGVYGVTATINQYFAALMAHPPDISSAFAFRYLSPGPEASFGNSGSPQTITDPAATDTFTIRSDSSLLPIDWVEVFVWDGQLSMSERAAFVTYADTKYGALPHA